MARDTLIERISRKVAIAGMAVASFSLGSCSDNVLQGANNPPLQGANNPPRITSSPVTRVDENTDYRYQAVATDEDNDELFYSLKNSPEWLSVSEDGLIKGTAPSVDDDDKVRVEVVVSDGKDSVSQSYGLFVRDVDEPIDPNATTIQGRLQDSETDMGSEGEVRAYKENSDGTYALLDSDRTDADGRFTLSFNQEVPNFDLQARLVDGNVDKSYVRTINLPGENNSDFLVRAVPYTGLNGNTVETDISVEQFQNFIYDAVADEDEGITKWNLDNLEGIEVIDDNPTSNTGYFTPEELNFIEGVLTDKNDGRIYFNGRSVPVQIDSPSTPDSEKHYDVFVPGDSIRPDEGWIIVVPKENIIGVGHAYVAINEEGYRIGGFVALNPKEPEEGSGGFLSHPGTVSHELGHIAFYYGGREPGSHSPAVRHSQSITSNLHRIGEPECTKPCFADRKVGKMMYEDTFATKTPAGNIVGLEWRD